MANVTVTWTTVPQTFPPDTVAGNFKVTISDGGLAAPLEQVLAAPSAVFAGVVNNPVGTPYLASVQRLDSAGAALGPVASANFDVAIPADVTADVPNAVTVVVA